MLDWTITGATLIPVAWIVRNWKPLASVCVIAVCQGVALLPWSPPHGINDNYTLLLLVAGVPNLILFGLLPYGLFSSDARIGKT